MSTPAHRAGPVPHRRTGREPQHVQRGHQGDEAGDATGHQALRVRPVANVARDDRGIGPEAICPQHPAVIGLFDQRLVEPLHARRAAAFAALLQRRAVRDRAPERDPTEPAPADRVGDLPAQRLEAEAAAVPHVHEAQEPLHGNGTPPELRLEERPERLEERRVVEQLVHPGQLSGHHQRLWRQHRTPTSWAPVPMPST